MEITNNALQTVSANQDVLFSNTVVCGKSSITHRSGSGLVNLRGLTNCQNSARFRAHFGANIRIPTTGAVGPISLTIALDGEPLSSTSMIFTPPAVNQFGNVSSEVFIDVPRGCCSQVSIRNTSTQTIEVQNANLIVERVA